MWRIAYWVVLTTEWILIQAGGWLLDMGEDLEGVMDRLKERNAR